MSHLPPTEKEKFTYGILIIPVTTTSQKMGERRFAFLSLVKTLEDDCSDRYANNRFQF